jgi:hypothetical protein
MRRTCVMGLALAVVTGWGSPARAVDTTWTLNGNGNWNVGANWSGGVVPNNNTFDVFIDDGDSAVTVTLNLNTTIGTLSIGANDALSFADTFDLTVAGGSVVNNGVISLNATSASNTDFNFIAAVTTLSGSGTLSLGAASQNRVTNSFVTNELINSATHTIAGGGQLGFNGMKLTNHGTVDANLAAATMVVDPSSSNASNTGTMRASNGGVLRLQGGVYTNTGGFIRALNGSAVELFGGSGASGTHIIGGDLASEGTGVIRTVGGDGGVTLQDVTLAAGSQFQFGTNLDANVQGTFTNNGTVDQPSSGGTMQLNLPASATFTGNGVWTMSGTALSSSVIRSSVGAPTLTNDAQHTIQGQGNIGSFTNIIIDNKGTILANQAIPLQITTSASGSFVNSGTLRATAGATLTVSSGVTSTGGMIVADEASTVNFTTRGAAFDGTTFTTTGTGVVVFSPAAGHALDDVTINGLVRFSNDADAVLRGTITNNGTVEQNSTASQTSMLLDGNVTVSGTGIWTISNNANNQIRRLSTGAPTAVLTNGAGHTIQGAGLIGLNEIGLVNEGLVIADQVLQMIIDPSAENVVNQATGVMRGAGGGGLTLDAGSFDNQGTIEALNGSKVTYGATGVTANNIAGVLTGGTWRAVATGGGATLTLRGSNITQIAAGTTVELSGAGSVLQTQTGINFFTLDTNLTTNAGTLRIFNGRTFAMTAALSNTGTVELGGAGLTDATLNSGGNITNAASGTIFGHGAISDTILNSGTVRAAGGTLTMAGRIDGQSGTVQVDGGATLDLSGAGGASDADFLIHNGAGLHLGANIFLVGMDYQNANFGVGNAFNARANVAGAGLINASPGVTQTLAGSVTGGGTATATMAFGNIHVGDAPTLNYQINNVGASGPSLRGAIQTTVGGASLTDARLGGAGVTAGNFGPIAVGANSGNLPVTFNATAAGALTGQQVRIVNNFDNVAEQTLAITGAAYRFANPTAHTPEPVNLGNRHVGDAAPSQALSITNNVPADGFSETLNAGIGTPTGGVTTNGGTIIALAPGATNTTSMSVGYSTATAGDKSGTATIILTSNGTGSSGLGLTALPAQTVNVTGSVFRLASAGAHTPEPINFGIVHVGDVVEQALSIGNTATSDGFSERLNGSIGSPTGNATTNSGSFNGLTPGATNSTSLVVGVSTATAGAKTGTATIGLVSSGAGTSGLPDTALASQTVNVSAMVNNFAVAQIVKLAGAGTLTPTGPNQYTFDLGATVQGQGSLSGNLGVKNNVAAPADSLAGSFTLAAPGYSLSGFDSFSNLSAGDIEDGLMVTLPSTTAGTIAGQITLSPQSTNPRPFSMNLPNVTINLTGRVFLPADFDEDGDVDGADLGRWTSNYATGSTHQQGNADGDGDSDGADFLAWQRQLGTSAPSVASGAVVPEPASAALLLLAVLASLASITRRVEPN